MGVGASHHRRVSSLDSHTAAALHGVGDLDLEGLDDGDCMG